MENAIEVKSIQKHYKDFSLKNVSFTLPRGYIMGFIGANGSGKTTTIKSILNLVKLDGGCINIYGTDSREMSPAEKEKIGVVLDSMPFPKTMTCEDLNNIFKNIYTSWDSEKFFSMCRNAKLPVKNKLNTFSKGMEMKLSIAVAMSHDPRLLIMDEPTAGLDPVARSEVLDMLMEFIQDESRSVLLSSHITSDLEKITDYLVFIQNGKIILSGEKDVLLDKYAVLKCSEDILSTLPQESVVSYKTTKFGTSRLVYKDKLSPPENCVVDRANIEDIMIFYQHKEKSREDI